MRAVVTQAISADLIALLSRLSAVCLQWLIRSAPCLAVLSVRHPVVGEARLRSACQDKQRRDGEEKKEAAPVQWSLGSLRDAELAATHCTHALASKARGAGRAPARVPVLLQAPGHGGRAEAQVIELNCQGVKII